MTIYSTSAPAKIILFGEHAVVYGHPAIAAPVDTLRARARVEKAPPDSGVTILIPSIGQRLHVNPYEDTIDNTLTFTVRQTLETLEIAHHPDLIIILESDIPIASGLGSGAAVSAAIARALSHAIDRPFSDDALNDLVYTIEKRHHGTPSGIDNTVIVYEKPIYFVRGQPIESIKVAQPVMLLIADSGHATPTHITVGDVRRLHEKEPDQIGAIFGRIGALAQQARSLLESGNPESLGGLMIENHSLLQRLTVSSPALDLLCDAALEGGASGAKMSGGGRGGNMIALVNAKTRASTEKALRSAGARNIIRFDLGGE